MVDKAQTKLYETDGSRHFIYLPKNLVTDSQFPLEPRKKVIASITERVLMIHEEGHYENIPVPRDLYNKFNMVLEERQLPFRDPADYIVQHLQEVIKRHVEWRKEMMFAGKVKGDDEAGP